MNLVIFDIDGTLTQTNKVDSLCFIRAVEEVMQEPIRNTNWSSYTYSTDSGILKEIWRVHFQREPHVSEIENVQERFVAYLQQEFLIAKESYEPILGATTLFQHIDSLKNWHIAIATGGWKKSALFKLDKAKIPHEHLPKAFADDHIERVGIIETAIHRANHVYGITSYERIMYVGDRAWDKRAAQQLNLEFVGIGEDFIKGELAEVFTLFNFDEYKNFLRYLSLPTIEMGIT